MVLSKTKVKNSLIPTIIERCTESLASFSSGYGLFELVSDEVGLCLVKSFVCIYYRL